jgi:tRNA pseudouridine38-40 synthase
MRAARTDKGVHAAGNVVSLKMIVDIEDVIGNINSHLPEQIRIFGYVRTLNAFNAKTLCESRVYQYLVPTYVFLPRPPLSPPKATPTETVIREELPEGSLAWDENVHISTAEEMVQKRSYRIDAETLAKVREGFAAYIGTKNFHNFTIKKDFKEKACQRYMMKFDVSEGSSCNPPAPLFDTRAGIHHAMITVDPTGLLLAYLISKEFGGLIYGWIR